MALCEVWRMRGLRAMALPAALTLATACYTTAGSAQPSPERQLLWGDTHLHTNLSMDAVLNQNLTADPDTAYRFAKGLPVVHPYTRTRVQLARPLDFLLVSDHAEFLGVLRSIYRDDYVEEDAGFIDRIKNWFTGWYIRRAIDREEGMALFSDRLPVPGDAEEAAASFADSLQDQLPTNLAIKSQAWEEITGAAARHYEPGTFTTLIGWEWSANPGGSNQHRIVVSDIDALAAREFLPFGSDSSPYPDDLWAFLERTSDATGATFMAMPHNSNISKGRMFSDRTLRGEPIDAAYAANRVRWEPVAEITQIKGDSEAHTSLSPDDEFADFEEWSFYIQNAPQAYVARKGDYLRTALGRGLELGARIGVNPYRLGLIGSTDSHAGLSTADENNFWGKFAYDSIPEHRTTANFGRASGWNVSASGMAAVWAEENTRESIMEALQRREVYATTGPRITLRFYAGWNPLVAVEDDEVSDLAEPIPVTMTAPEAAVPMGGELIASAEEPPVFFVSAQKDPDGANLDRVQIIKGWLDSSGVAQERVYNVAWSGTRALNARGKLPAVGNTVNLKRATYRNSIGAADLTVTWRDPDYQPGEQAFYYVRVLEIPTPRHALRDAIALGMEAPNVGPSTIQERAYSSPIWVVGG